jgi:hypothetical protein
MGNAAAQEIRPGELAEGRRSFDEAAGASECARQAPIGIVPERYDRCGDFTKGSASSLCVIGMAPPPHIQRPPEFIGPKGGKVRDRLNADVLHALFLQGAHKMVAMDQVKSARRPSDDGRNDARRVPSPRRRTWPAKQREMVCDPMIGLGDQAANLQATERRAVQLGGGGPGLRPWDCRQVVPHHRHRAS